MIEGVSHITFIVSDLERTAAFFKTVFDADEVYSSGGDTFSLSKEKFFLIGGQWIAIMEGAALAEKTYNHVAFKIADGEYDDYLERIRSLGVEPGVARGVEPGVEPGVGRGVEMRVKQGVEMREGRSRVPGEGRSLYFYDYDNHLFELHTGTLEQRLKRYRRSRG